MKMTKPRLFINMHYLELGGAERALIGFMNAIDTDRVEVDLFLNQHTGAFLPHRWNRWRNRRVSCSAGCPVHSGNA